MNYWSCLLNLSLREVFYRQYETQVTLQAWINHLNVTYKTIHYHLLYLFYPLYIIISVVSFTNFIFIISALNWVSEVIESKKYVPMYQNPIKIILHALPVYLAKATSISVSMALNICSVISHSYQ